MEWTANTVCDYIAQTQLLGNNKLVAEEIGDGNLNLVFRIFVEDHPTQSLILKQAPPYIKILGPEYPLTQRRLAIEARALELYHQLVPGSVPELLLYDEEESLILMADLQGFRILRTVLIDGEIRSPVAASVGAFMGNVHRATHVRNISTQELERYQSDFYNPDMHAITADYVFTKPFQEDPTNWHTPGLEPIVADVRADSRLLGAIRELRERFLNAQEGVVHGDLHTGSVMVQGDEARVIDAEFAFFGPIAFDVGAFIANYLLAWYAHPPADRPILMKCIEQCWETYSEYFGVKSLLKSVWRESIQFAGVKMLRRILGAAHVQDIESIQDVEQRCAVEKQAITCGRALIMDPPSSQELARVVKDA